MLVTKAKSFLSDEGKRRRLSEKKHREAAREQRHTQRFKEMDAQRKRFKGDLEAREAKEREASRRQRPGGGGRGPGHGAGEREGGGINAHVLDELRRMGQAQREAEARRMEELLHKSNAAAEAAMARRAAEGGQGPGEAGKEGAGEGEGEGKREEREVGEGLKGAPSGVSTRTMGASTEVRVKWKRSQLEESFSDESLYQLLVRYGPIKAVEMTGVKVREGSREGGRKGGGTRERKGGRGEKPKQAGIGVGEARVWPVRSAW